MVTLPPMPSWGKLHPTALEALIMWVLSDRPHIDITVSAPWEVPNWGAQLVCMGKDPAWARKEWVQTLTDFVPGSSYEIVHIARHVRRVPHMTYNMGSVASMFINGEGEQPIRSWSLGRDLCNPMPMLLHWLEWHRL